MGNAIDIDLYSDLFMPYFFFKCESSEVGICSLEEYALGMTHFKQKTFKDLKKDYYNVKEKYNLILKIDQNRNIIIIITKKKKTISKNFIFGFLNLIT